VKINFGGGYWYCHIVVWGIFGSGKGELCWLGAVSLTLDKCPMTVAFVFFIYFMIVLYLTFFEFVSDLIRFSRSFVRFVVFGCLRTPSVMQLPLYTLKASTVDTMFTP